MQKDKREWIFKSQVQERWMGKKGRRRPALTTIGTIFPRDVWAAPAAAPLRWDEMIGLWPITKRCRDGKLNFLTLRFSYVGFGWMPKSNQFTQVYSSKYTLVGSFNSNKIVWCHLKDAKCSRNALKYEASVTAPPICWRYYCSQKYNSSKLLFCFKHPGK